MMTQFNAWPPKEDMVYINPQTGEGKTVANPPPHSEVEATLASLANYIKKSK